MRKDMTAMPVRSAFSVLEASRSIGALPRNPRDDARLRRVARVGALLLLALGLVMVYSSSIAMAEASRAHRLSRLVFPRAARDFVAVGVASRRSSRSRCR